MKQNPQQQVDLLQAKRNEETLVILDSHQKGPSFLHPQLYREGKMKRGRVKRREKRRRSSGNNINTTTTATSMTATANSTTKTNDNSNYHQSNWYKYL